MMLTATVREGTWHAEAFRQVFGRPAAPISSQAPVRRVFHRRASPVPVEMTVYQLDVARLAEAQLDALVAYIVARFQFDRAVVRGDLLGDLGCPIPAEDVVLVWREDA